MLELSAIALLTLALLILAYRYYRLLIRCTLAEEKSRLQQHFQESFEQISKETLYEAQGKLQEKAALEESERRKLLAEMLSKLEKQIGHLELERKSDHGALKEQLRALLQTEYQLKSETSKLTQALRSPAGRGRWGEIQLRRVVELAGMVANCDFFEQQVEMGDGIRRKPDVIIRLPGQRQVVIDAKVPLEAYLEAVDQIDEKAKHDKLKEHAKRLKDHIVVLGKKNYWEHFQPTPEFVVLFLPSDAIFAIALEIDPTLMELAVQHGIILATPMTLIALLKGVAYGWKQEHLSQYAEKISTIGQELYKRVSDLSIHWGHLRKALDHAVTAFNDATGSLEKNVFSSVRKFQDLGAANPTQPIKEASLIDQSARPFVSEELKTYTEEGSRK